jgi:hypothetical protein
MKRIAVGVVASSLVVLSLAACGGAQTRSAEKHACEELKPLLATAPLTPAQTKQAVTLVHGWTSQIIDDDDFRAAGQALYTAFQRSNSAAFDASVQDLRARCDAR